MKHFFLITLLAFVSSCSSTSDRGHTLIKSTHLKMDSAPAIGKTSSGQDIYLGGLSGLILKDVINSDELLFQAVTDRGPNGYNEGIERPFLIADYSPRIIELKANLKTHSLEVKEQLPLKKKDGSPLTGLPNARTEENPINISGFMISLDADGMDTESIVADGEGGYWIGEEYAPSMANFDASGKLRRRLMPYAELPKLYSERKPNRGFEAIAKDQNKLWGFLQSPLNNEKFLRIVEVDLESMKTNSEYFYPMDADKDRIGDAILLGKDKFLVIEHNGKKNESAKKAIYKITLNGNDQLVKKELIIDLKNTAFKNLEKIEGLALIDKKRIAMVNDNDFQIAGKTNKADGITPLNKDGNEMLILEFSEDLTK